MSEPRGNSKSGGSGEPDQPALRLGLLWFDSPHVVQIVERDWLLETDATCAAMLAGWQTGSLVELPASADWQLTTDN
jgi:hypothetical protein